MISKNSFFKLQKEDLKRRIWTIALAVVVFFLCFPIASALLIGNYTRYLTKEKVYEQIYNFIQPNALIIIITVAGAIICGLSGYFFLHSKTKVDLYHSIPVRRELIFVINYINGILIYLIPYVISIILTLVIIQINGFMSAELITTAFGSILLNLLYYILIYTVVIITDMLTGNFVVNLLGAAVFLLYGPFIIMLKEGLFSIFFKTYYSNFNIEWKKQFLSPVGSYISVADKITRTRALDIIWNILLVLLITIILVLIALFLYKKRPSEAAGKAMSFGISKPIIKFLLVIPITLAGGLMFRGIADRGKNGWLIFGLIFTLMLSYAIIEIIYNFDIRSAFRNKKHLLACAGIIAVLTCIFKFDLLQYDNYIPNQNSIKSMSVSIAGLDDNIRYFEKDTEYASFIDNTEYQLKHMDIKEFGPAYQMAQLGLKHVDDAMDSEDYFQYTVKYKLKNGRSIYRVYQLKKDESFELMNKVYADPDFKNVHYSTKQVPVEGIGVITCNNLLQGKEFSLSPEEKKELFNLYNEELDSLTLDEMVKDKPSATFSFEYNRNYTGEYYVYPSFNKTIAFMKSHGFDPTKEVTASDIKSVDVMNYNALSENGTTEVNGNVEVSYSEKEVKTTSYDNRNQAKEVAEIYNNLIQRDYYWNNRSIFDADESVEVNITFRMDDYGNEVNNAYYFEKGNIPDFVKRDIAYIEE